MTVTKIHYDQLGAPLCGRASAKRTLVHSRVTCRDCAARLAKREAAFAPFAPFRVDPDDAAVLDVLRNAAAQYDLIQPKGMTRERAIFAVRRLVAAGKAETFKDVCGNLWVTAV